ncbi:MAG: glycosyltransferase family 2 protein [Bdellovibrionales bacterium]|nr:glycosyltransferase family 2 protein [Bdellovibrionales bacterium]
MKISIVLPAYNEENNIAQAVSDCVEYLSGKSGEIIVVDDGSTDQTSSLLENLCKKHGDILRVIRHKTNLGYATSLKDGFLATTGDWIFYTDSDLQFDIQDIDLLLPHQDSADIIVGYRINRQDPATRKFAAKIYNLIIRCFFGLRVRDVDCAFKLFRRQVFDQIRIESSHFLVDAEILIKAKTVGISIAEVGVKHRPRYGGESKVRFQHVAYTILGLAKFWYQINLGGGIPKQQRIMPD